METCSRDLMRSLICIRIMSSDIHVRISMHNSLYANEKCVSRNPPPLIYQQLSLGVKEKRGKSVGVDRQGGSMVIVSSKGLWLICSVNMSFAGQIREGLDAGCVSKD